MRALLLLSLLAACGPADDGSAQPKDRNTTDVLVLPDMEGLDMEAAYRDALTMATTVAATRPWDAHVSLLAERDPACPDVYAGVPGDMDELDPDMGGASWSDFCETSAGRTWGGWSWWNSTALMSGNPAGITGATADGSREMIADGSITTADGAIWELDATISESLHRAWSPYFDTWTWTSRIEGTHTGSEVFAGTETPDGWRTDLAMFASKGDANRFEARGNIYMFDSRLHGRFDSMVMDLEVVGTVGAPEGACFQEPLGWIGLRDENAYWYDLVFLPRTAPDLTEPPYANDPLSVCDGCGTLYVRGVEVGEVCVDLSFVLDGLITPPDIDTFVFPLRDLPGGL